MNSFTEEITIDEASTLEILLKLFDGVADVKLYKMVDSDDEMLVDDDHTLVAQWTEET